MKSSPRRLLPFVALLSAFFALTSLSHAGRHGGGGGPARTPPKIPYTAIIAVDTAAMTITVAPKNSNATGTKTYKYTAKTTITVKGHYGTVADLVPGLQIHVGAGMDPEVAEEISVTDAPADPVTPTPRPQH